MSCWGASIKTTVGLLVHGTGEMEHTRNKITTETETKRERKRERDRMLETEDWKLERDAVRFAP